MPANKIKKPKINLQENRMLRNILTILYGEDDIDKLSRNNRVKIYSYNHCETLEELEFDIFADLVQSGMPVEQATLISKESARELWEYS